MVQRPISMQRAAAWDGGGARQRMMSPESCSARGALVATPCSRGSAHLTGQEGWVAGWVIRRSRWESFFLKSRAAPGRTCSVGR